MLLSETVALVSGANRGIGAAFVQALLAGGVQKVYAGARDPLATLDPRVVAVHLDVTPFDRGSCRLNRQRRDASD